MLYNLQLPRSCQTFKFRNGTKEQTIYIVGTAHVSAASCDDVRAVIRAVKPEVMAAMQEYLPADSSSSVKQTVSSINLLS